jgi:hypothetical protein
MPRKKAGFNLSAQIIKHLRQVSRTYPVKKEVLKKARREKHPDGYWLLQCAGCASLHAERLVQVDHTSPVGSFDGCWNTYISRMFCEESNLRVLCIGCHKEKTLKDRADIRDKKRAQK